MTLTKTEVKEAVIEALEDVGMITPYLTRKEIVAQIGRHRYDKAIKAGHLHRNKQPGQSAKVRVLRREFQDLERQGII